MSTPIDIHTLEILASKICHDLISPVGAVANGVEFLEEMGPDAGDEVTDLIKFSAVQASSKLQVYRMAYGAGGADASIKFEDVHGSFMKLIGQENKVKLEWDPYAQLGPDERPAGMCKMIMCVFILCLECLPKGGSISVAADGDRDVLFTVRGENAGIMPPCLQALNGQVAQKDVEPRVVHSYVCGLLADYYNFKLTMQEHSEGFATFKLAV